VFTLERDADAQRRHGVDAADVVCGFESAQQVARHDAQRRNSRGAFNLNRKLVAAKPRHDVGFAHHAADAGRHAAQHRVAGRRAERVVDEAEAIDVEHKHAYGALRAAPLRE